MGELEGGEFLVEVEVRGGGRGGGEGGGRWGLCGVGGGGGGWCGGRSGWGRGGVEAEELAELVKLEADKLTS